MPRRAILVGRQRCLSLRRGEELDSSPLLAFVGGAEVARLVANSGPVAKGVLVVLLLFSLFSWTVIFAKWRSFRRVRAQSDSFVRAFRRSEKFSELHATSDQFHPSPLVVVFQFGYEELRNQAAGANPRSGLMRPNGIVAVQRALQIASSEQLTALERMLGWLATTGAITPFIGLFGTVWGIMDSFSGLGSAGSASLRVVAPGISEALVTTAAGLFVAIPAVIAYNHFLGVLREFGMRMDNFSLEFLNVSERNYTS